MKMPLLETDRLRIRPFSLDDLDDFYRINDLEIWKTGMAKEERAAWLQWAVLNHEQLAAMYQPPYGDRAVVLKESGELVGSVGYVPLLGPYSQLPDLGAAGPHAPCATEFGLYWAIAPAQQRRGYASEAAQALISYAFSELRLDRILATTGYENVASQAVMRKLGMALNRNPYPEPEWMQVVGVLFNSNL